MKSLKNKHILAGILSLLIITFLAGCSKKNDDNASPASGSYSVSGTSYSGPCTSVPDVGTGGALGHIDVLIVTTSGASFLIYNMPTQSSGTYNFTDGYDNAGGSALYALCTLPPSTEIATRSGSVTKTGSKSFTFSCTCYDIISNQSYTVSGKGSY